MRVMVYAHISSTGRAFSSASALPPTMMVGVPLMAPISPPDTGASRKSPGGGGLWRRRQRLDGAHVDGNQPGWAPWITPCSPSMTSSTSGVSETLLMTISTSRASWPGWHTPAHPWATSSAALSGRRAETDRRAHGRRGSRLPRKRAP